MSTITVWQYNCRHRLLLYADKPNLCQWVHDMLNDHFDEQGQSSDSEHLGEHDSRSLRVTIDQKIGSIDGTGKVTGVEVHHAEQVIIASGQEAILPEAGETPYKGLDLYEVADAPIFFGREKLTSDLVSYIREHSFLAIVGASGSGKSSLARAGLIAALLGKTQSSLKKGVQPPLGSHNWHFVSITPTAQPFEALAHAFAGERSDVKTLFDLLTTGSVPLEERVKALLGTSNHLLLLVDQFEELFTLCKAEDERINYINLLLAACNSPDFHAANARCTVILTMRADYYDQCGRYERLRNAIMANQCFIGAMNRSELLQTIELPAQIGHWAFQQGLVEQILDDVGDEPGKLPLLSHAMLETWHRRSGRVMTLAGYRDAGGVHKAISKTADRVFSELVSQGLGDVARRIFLSLIAPGDEGRATRLREQLRDLVPETSDSPEAKVLQALSASDARLVIVDKDAIQISHEALINAWPKLNEWLHTYSYALQLLDSVRDAAEIWQNAPEVGKIDLLIHRGSRLEEALKLRDSHEFTLGVVELKYLESCVGLRDSQAREKEYQQERELEQLRALATEAEKRQKAEAQRVKEAEARARAERERGEIQAEAVHNLRRLVTILTVVGTLAAIAMIFAFQQASVANARGVLAQAQTANAEGKYHLATLLGLEANLRVPGTADDLLARIPYEGPAVGRVITRGTSPIKSISWSPGGLLVSSFENGDVDLWDTTFSKLIFHINVAPAIGTQLAWSSSGQLAIATDHGTISIWDVKKKQQVSHLETGTGISALAWLGDEHLAYGSINGLVGKWEIGSAANSLAWQGHIDEVSSVVWLSGGLLASASLDRNIFIWDSKTGQKVSSLAQFSKPVGSLIPLKNDVLVVGTDDGLLSTWDSQKAVLLARLQANQGAVTSLAVSPNGQIASGSADGKVILWNLETHQPVAIYQEYSTGKVAEVAWSPDGRLASGTSDGVLILWDLRTGRKALALAGHSSPVESVAWSLDGRLATGDKNGVVKVWDGETGSELQTYHIIHLAKPASATLSDSSLFSVKGYGGVRSIAWIDNDHLVSGVFDGRVILWNIVSEEGIVLGRHKDSVESVISYNGKIASGSSDGDVILWDTVNRTPKFEHTTDSKLTTLTGMAWSPDGRMIAVSGLYSNVFLWTPGDTSIQSLSGSTAITLGLGLDEMTGLAWETNGILAVAVSQLTNSKNNCRMDNTGKITCEICQIDNNYKYTCNPVPNPEDIILWKNPVQDSSINTLSGGHTKNVNCVAWSPDGRLASGGNDGSVVIWDIQNASANMFHRLKGHTAAVTSIAWSSSGQLASGDASGNIIIWNEQSDSPQYIVSKHTDAITGLTWSPDGHLASSSADGTIIVWDDKKEVPLETLSVSPDESTGGVVEQLAWSPTGILAAGTDNGDLAAWDTSTHQMLTLPASENKNEIGPITGLAWSSKNSLTWAKGYSAQNIYVWNPLSGAISTLHGNHINSSNISVSNIEGLAWSPDGRLASGDSQGNIVIWKDASIVQLKGSYKRVFSSTFPLYQVAWSADNRLASGGQDGTIMIWNEINGKANTRLTSSSPVTGLTWSPSGVLSSSHIDGSILIWDEAEAKPAVRLIGHEGKVNAIAWSNNSLLASAGEDNIIRIIPTTLAQTPCAWLGRNLTQNEWEQLSSIALLSFAGLDLRVIPAYRPTCSNLPIPSDAIRSIILKGESIWVLYASAGLIILVMIGWIIGRLWGKILWRNSKQIMSTLKGVFLTIMILVMLIGVVLGLQTGNILGVFVMVVQFVAIFISLSRRK